MTDWMEVGGGGEERAGVAAVVVAGSQRAERVMHPLNMYEARDTP